MDAPYTIATLPRPLDSENGRIQASPVYTLRSSRKRKRHEIAVGIDGEGVNIYDVQSQNQVTSYALPPQTYLCCPPCSVYVKKDKVTGAQRQTYMVVRDGPTDVKRRLVCVTEGLDRWRQLDDQLATPAKKELKLHSGDVLALEVVAARSETAAPQVLVSYRNGDVACVSGDLSKLSWEHNVISVADESQKIDVEYASLVDAETAQKGLLASREDVTAQLDTAISGTTGADGRTLFCSIIRSDTHRSLQIHALRLQGSDAIQSQKPGMQLVMEYELPAGYKQSSEHASYELHPASGKLYQLLDGRLTVYDLIGTIPRVTTTLGSKASPIFSFARVSSSSLLAAFADKAEVYETRYGSVQSSAPLLSNQTMEVAGQKRKRIANDEPVNQFWHAISSFSELGLVVGLAGNEVSALQLTENLRGTKRAKSGGTLLIDVLAKDVVDIKSKESHNAEKNEKRAKKLEEWKAEVDSAVDDHRVSELETLTARALHLKSVSVEPRRQEYDSNELVLHNGEAGHGHTPEVTMESFDTARIDRHKAIYILSKCFSMRSENADPAAGTNRLTTTIGSKNVYKWLTLAGFLTKPYVQQGIALGYPMSGTVAKVQPGDIMTALSSFDNFQIVHDILAPPVHWELPEVVQVLKLLVQSFETPFDGTAAQKALTAPATSTNGDVPMLNGDADSEVESELLATEKDLDRAVSALSTGLEVRSETLRLVLRRLHAFPQRVVTKTMRAMMKHEELIFFMKILRIELLAGGWTSRYVDVGNADIAAVDAMDGVEDTIGPIDQAIGTISDLMNCAIDAVGTSGWLVGQSGDAYGTEELIDALKSEVSASLEGLFEADTVNTFLDDLQRYDFSVQKTEGSSERRKRKNEVEVEIDLSVADAMLPMGCRAEAAGVKDRSTKDGKKSKHVFEKERRGRVGAYSVDRIRI
ncbi:hypothetical protein LTR36_008362 [Oleoguttula mirabilis]|uniref:Utp8 beta-propeller domain-containing protein n=1 Tax=Oleoguttula mirabilis TaxID=1507867 RepID=A0AAV9J7M3_9PEZI|nr:hypothetical protein LTR36_008362 [Oleoguttula mirabilis]